MGDDFTAPCINTETSFAYVQNGLTEWAARFEAADKYLMYVVPPDKSAIRRDDLGPLADSLMVCSDRARENLETWASAAEFPFLTLWDAESVQDEAEPCAYLYGDTHWNWHGASVMTKAVLAQLVEDGEAPEGLLSDLDTLVVGSEQVFTGDLYRLMGLDRTDDVTTVVYQRPDVTTTRETGTSPAGLAESRWTSESDTAEFVPGRTLIMGDSFLGFTESQLPGFFEDVTYRKTATAPTPGELASMGDYDRVIVERVQRFAAYQVTGLLFDLSFSLE